jgi:hypothetical protein
VKWSYVVLDQKKKKNVEVTSDKENMPNMGEATPPGSVLKPKKERFVCGR